ncbi:Ribosomal protein S18 acetylase RimI [Actinacidiphila rubida]|uniref:Ribosomal protein S18 acetylase RimI n=1 Tax=Actinacidiphila rubida TaxID=310780 RepID=A0A1H8DB66_9ACTN|nr:GNAT family N-acetyltransferase [Actinacidiphila rubida]SEN04510.1 Ribosomal protein S18 acetylase RimI [Actinacidiphila rubida]
MDTVTVAPARPEDHDRWRELFGGYAAFYDVTLSDEEFDRAWRWIHDPARTPRCLLARTGDGRVVGLAHFRVEESPLQGERGFLDDIYVDPAHRGGGAVDALLGEIRRVGAAEGWPHVRWRTAEDNYRARSAYDRHATRTPFLTYAMATAD